MKLKPQVGDFESLKGTYFDPGWSLLIRPVTEPGLQVAPGICRCPPARPRSSGSG